MSKRTALIADSKENSQISTTYTTILVSLMLKGAFGTGMTLKSFMKAFLLGYIALSWY